MVLKKIPFHKLWWITSIISTLRRLRQEDFKFEVSLSSTVRPYLNNIKYDSFSIVYMSLVREEDFHVDVVCHLEISV